MKLAVLAATMLIPLHVKSHYSLGLGTTSVEHLVERAAMLGLPAMGLTDVDNLYAQVLFHRQARERGIKPITGVEICLGDASAPRLVLLARDRAGYENICRIITRHKLRDPSTQPILDFTGLTDGLFALTDDPSLLERILLSSFERRFTRLLLIRPGAGVTREQHILDASLQLQVPVVADPDIVFLDPDDRPLLVLQVAIARNLLVSRVEEGGLLPGTGRHFPGPREVESLFADLPAAVQETQRIADACELDLRKSRPIFPRIPLPSGETAYSHLAKLAFRGLEKRRPLLTPLHFQRLARELEVIDRLGFSEYFIVVGDIVRFARERQIEVVGRGSGAGSLVAYALGVTNVDPIQYRLYFERFLHEGRSDLPDIDIDLCWIRRDEVIHHVYEAYGHDRVAMISSHVTFQPHLAFRESIKAFGIPIEEVNRYSRMIPHIHPDVTSRTPLRDLIASSPHSRDIPFAEEPFRTAISLAERLLHKPHHLSVHPGGIVMGDRAIDAYVPLERAAKGVVVTQYDMYSIEEVGLVKIDLLGNRCLTEIQETLDQARTAGVSLELSGIPDRDPATIEILQAARTVCCFQLESPAMRSLMAKVQAASILDCIAAVAIIRPGAAAGGAKEAYIRRRRGEESPAYLHASLQKLLEESHGIVIYEEDVMCIASTIAGISLAEGDALRSALKKCRHPDDIRDLENGFLRQSVQNGIQPDVARAIWEDLRKFSAYCFSKAHASGYGVLAYQSAYLKAHFPCEFGCAVLNNHAGMYSTRTIAEEVKRMGVTILHPSINCSGARFLLERPSPGGPPHVRTGLARVKSLSSASIDSILSARSSGKPFASLGDFLRRVSIPRREVEALILTGSFDDLMSPRGMSEPLNHPQLLWQLESMSRSREANEHGSGGAWLSLDDGLEYPLLSPYDAMKRIQNELELLEMGLTDHPMRLLREAARQQGCITTIEAGSSAAGRRIRVAGLLAATRTIRTKKGDRMQFLTIEDEQGLLEGTLFPEVYRKFSARVHSLGPHVIEGTVENDHGALNLNVFAIHKPLPP